MRQACEVDEPPFACAKPPEALRHGEYREKANDRKAEIHGENHRVKRVSGGIGMSVYASIKNDLRHFGLVEWNSAPW